MRFPILRAIDFGIRKITQARDADNKFPDIGTGGNFYLQINGRDYLIRGGVYSPDLLFRNDPQRDANIMRYAKDLGLNLLRWELKIADAGPPVRPSRWRGSWAAVRCRRRPGPSSSR